MSMPKKTRRKMLSGFSFLGSIILVLSSCSIHAQPIPSLQEDSFFANMKRSLQVGANCIMAGGGTIVPFEACRGCIARAAFSCVQDMRLNATGTVPKGCRIEDLSLDGKKECCAKFSKPKRPGTIIKTTSAYPEAFTCLIDVGCVGYEAWRDLVNECKQNHCSSDFACQKLQSPASRQYVSYGLLVASSAVAVIAIQLLGL